MNPSWSVYKNQIYTLLVQMLFLSCYWSNITFFYKYFNNIIYHEEIASAMNRRSAAISYHSDQKRKFGWFIIDLKPHKAE